MTRFVSKTAVALSLLALGTAAEAQSYTAPAGIPAQTAQVPQRNQFIVVPPANYTAVYSSGSASTPVVHGRRQIQN